MLVFETTAGVDPGFLPTFILESDPRPLAEQINERYQHGGGWRPMGGWEIVGKSDFGPTIKYEEDGSSMEAIGRCRFRNEMLYLYDYDFLMILNDDGSFEVARVD